MSSYRRNKLKTALDIYRQIENWPTGLALRLHKKRRGLRLLSFRNGLQVVCRGGTEDWTVIHELYFKGIYNQAMAYLPSMPGRPVGFDLGANIGLFSLMAAATHPAAHTGFGARRSGWSRRYFRGFFQADHSLET